MIYYGITVLNYYFYGSDSYPSCYLLGKVYVKGLTWNRVFRYFFVFMIFSPASSVEMDKLKRARHHCILQITVFYVLLVQLIIFIEILAHKYAFISKELKVHLQRFYLRSYKYTESFHWKKLSKYFKINPWDIHPFTYRPLEVENNSKVLLVYENIR